MRIDNPNLKQHGGFPDGKRVLLSQTIINALSVSTIDLVLPSAYSYHEILIRDMTFTDDDVQLRVNWGDTTNEIIGDSIYDWVLHRSSLAGQAAEAAEGANSISLVPESAALGIGNATNEGFNAELFFHNTMSGVTYPNLQWRAAYMDASISTDVAHTRGSGQISQPRGVNLISFFPSAGNFLTAVVKHYGITGGTL